MTDDIPKKERSILLRATLIIEPIVFIVFMIEAVFMMMFSDISSFEHFIVFAMVLVVGKLYEKDL